MRYEKEKCRKTRVQGERGRDKGMKRGKTERDG